MKYLKNILKDEFIDEINSLFLKGKNNREQLIDDFLSDNNDVELEFYSEKDKKKTLSAILRNKLKPYSRTNFYQHIFNILDNGINHGNTFNLKVSEGDDDNSDDKIVLMAIKKMEGILITSSYLALLTGYSRANIAVLRDKGDYENNVVGDTFGYKLMDVI